MATPTESASDLALSTNDAKLLVEVQSGTDHPDLLKSRQPVTAEECDREWLKWKGLDPD